MLDYLLRLGQGGMIDREPPFLFKRKNTFLPMAFKHSEKRKLWRQCFFRAEEVEVFLCVPAHFSMCVCAINNSSFSRLLHDFSTRPCWEFSSYVRPLCAQPVPSVTCRGVGVWVPGGCHGRVGVKASLMFIVKYHCGHDEA